MERTCDEVTVEIGMVTNLANPGAQCDVLMSQSVPEGSIHILSKSQECTNTEDPKIMGMFLSPLDKVVKANKERKEHVSSTKDSMLVNCSFSSQSDCKVADISMPNLSSVQEDTDNTLTEHQLQSSTEPKHPQASRQGEKFGYNVIKIAAVQRITVHGSAKHLAKCGHVCTKVN